MQAAVAREVRGHQAVRVMPDLLQSLFVTDILAPPDRMWIVSPWISDIPVISNEAGEFSALVTYWETRRIRLTEFLVFLMESGTRLTIGTRRDEGSEPFVRTLSEHAPPSRLSVKYADLLHEKGLLSKDYYLSGSFNFTHGGVFINEEVARLYLDPSLIAENRIQFEERWR